MIAIAELKRKKHNEHSLSIVVMNMKKKSINNGGEQRIYPPKLTNNAKPLESNCDIREHIVRKPVHKTNNT